MAKGTVGGLRTELEKEAKQISMPLSDEVLSLFNEDQLWVIYMALERASKNLVEELAQADKALAKQFYDYGKREYEWT